MLNWAKEFIGSEILSKFMESGYKKLTDKLSEVELQRIVADFDSRFKSQMEQATRDEEIDLEGLQLYVEKELLGDIFNCLLTQNPQLRKWNKEKVLEAAYLESAATNPKKKHVVNKYLETVWSTIDAITDKQLSTSVRVQLNLMDEALESRIRQVEATLRKEIEQINAYSLVPSSFAYMIDQIKPKEDSTNIFHYLNPSIGFWGREKEIQALEDFLDDNREILYLGIVAPGGCGKSKLIHEFIQQHKYDSEWEMQYLSKGQIDRLLTFTDYRYPRKLMLIVDYAGLHAKQLGDWLYHLSSIRSSCRPVKIRLLLLEREQSITLNNLTIQPTWRKELHGTGEHSSVVRKLNYQHSVFINDGVLQPLTDDAIIQLMRQYAQKNNKDVSDEILQKLLLHLKSREKMCGLSARPLMAMFVMDAYVRGQPIFSWNKNEILKHFIERTEGQWARLCKDNAKLINCAANCVVYATLTGSLNLEAPPEYLSEDVKQLQALEDEDYFSMICAINQSADFYNIILPLEPDIVGEYFLFQRMQKMVFRKEKIQKVMDAAWSETNSCFAVFSRTIHDYGRQHELADFYLQNLDLLMPPDRNDSEIAAHSRLLHFMMITFSGSCRKSQVKDQVFELYRKHPAHLQVVHDYAAVLMLDFRNHFDNFEDQDANVEQINRLRLLNPDSEYLQVIYGKSLYNQIVSYVTLKVTRKDPEFRHACDKRIQCFFNELHSLLILNPQNQQIQESLLMANLMLYYPGMEDK